MPLPYASLATAMALSWQSASFLFARGVEGHSAVVDYYAIWSMTIARSRIIEVLLYTKFKTYDGSNVQCWTIGSQIGSCSDTVCWPSADVSSVHWQLQQICGMSISKSSVILDSLERTRHALWPKEQTTPPPGIIRLWMGRWWLSSTPLFWVKPD